MFRLLATKAQQPQTWAAVTLLACTLVSVSVRADAKSDAEDVDRFLTRLGLLDVQLVHAEQQLAAAANAADRSKLAGRLADLYAQRLMEVGDDTATYDDVMRRIKDLTTRHPSANTAALKVMLLQVDYNRAEKLVMQWVDSRENTDALAEAGVILKRIAPELDRSWREISKEVDATNRSIDELDNDDAIAAKEQEVRRLQVVGNRAAFFAGWANFYYGVSKQEPTSAKPNFQAGRSAFRHIFDLTDEDKYEDVEVDWLGLESIYRSRSLIGLGMCEIALDNIAGAEACFEFLNDISAPLEIRDQGASWFLLGLMQMGHWTEAVQFATEEVESYSGGATKGKIQFCVALILAEYGDTASSTPTTKQLAKLGVMGLARLREFGRLTQLMNKYDIELGDDAGFYLTWIKGQRLFTEAEKTKNRDTYAEAAETLKLALSQPEAKQDVAAAGQCQFVLGWCYYRLEQFEKAGKMFENAVLPLKASTDPNAVKAAWLAFASFHRMATDDDRGVLLATSAATTLKKEFPKSSEAGRVDFHLAKLRQAASSPAESIRRLEAIKPDDPNYVTARYELCLLRHQQWKESKGKPTAAKTAAADTFAAVDRYLSTASREEAALPMLKAGLMAVDIAMQTADLTSRATAYLDQLEPLANISPPSSSSVAEYHYQRLQLARRNDDSAAQEKHARCSWRTQAALLTRGPPSFSLPERQMPQSALQPPPKQTR